MLLPLLVPYAGFLRITRSHGVDLLLIFIFGDTIISHARLLEEGLALSAEENRSTVWSGSPIL